MTDWLIAGAGQVLKTVRQDLALILSGSTDLLSIKHR